VAVLFNDEIWNLTYAKSNGSVVGASSGTSLDTRKNESDSDSEAVRWTNRELSTRKEFIGAWKLAMSKPIVLPQVVHNVAMSPDPDTATTHQDYHQASSSGTKHLVTINLPFAIFGLVLAILAARATSPKELQL
jgi:hypothetical protein